MKKIFTFCLFVGFSLCGFAQNQLPCSNPVYRQFDFWIGEWNVFDKKGNKAGDSKITQPLGQCIILEEWESVPNAQQKLVYAGKSFNTFNRSTRQWQQTWVDNAAGTTEFLQGKFEDNKMTFISNPFPVAKDTMAIRRLTFYPLEKDKVRQHGEISKDQGKNWQTEYDLEYRRKPAENQDEKAIREVYFLMETYFKENKMTELAQFYLDDAKMFSNNLEIRDKEGIEMYWGQLKDRGISWEHDITSLEIQGTMAVQTGNSKMVCKNGNGTITYNTLYSLIWKKNKEGKWKIAIDHYSNKR